MKKYILILISFALIVLVGFFAFKKVYVAVDFNSDFPGTSSELAAVAESSNSSTVSSTQFEGFGANTGGSLGETILVTNLNDSGPGSLRQALANKRSNATVKFTVAGTINLKSDLWVDGHDLTLDGFSAPSPGITLTAVDNVFVVSGNSKSPDTTGSNIVIQGFRIRSPGGDAFQIAYNAHDIVVDHNSIYAAGDGGVDVTEGAHDVTVSWNIINKSGAGGSLLSTDASKVSYHHNIFYGNNDRNPIVMSTFSRYYSTGPRHQDPMADVRYNLIWNYGIGNYFISWDSVATGNSVSNLYKNNPQINPSNVVVRARMNSAIPRANVYVAGNACVHDCRGNAYSYNGTDSAFDFPGANSQSNQSAPFNTPTISGPSATDQAGRITEWTRVKNEAGLALLYADDEQDRAVRAAISIPTSNIFSELWNGEQAVTEVVPAGIKGDFNGDGLVNSLDYSVMSKKWNQTQGVDSVDVNQDGRVNISDYYLIIVNWLKS